ncbi:hypothetical protein [Bradyrhizobium ottawaense]
MAEQVYFVQVQGKSGRYWVERDPASMDFNSTVEDIADGQIEDIVSVLEIANGAATDATDKVSRAVMTKWAHEGEPLTHAQYNFVEMHVGTRAARSFLRHEVA